jgi:uncharacterized 2Fe-2S/4Fe-4S cluster protein (DUF4445 family)
VWIEDHDIRVHIIEQNKARGICGSGIIDLIAELVREGLITRDGKIIDPKDGLPLINDRMKKRIIQDEGEKKFLVVDSDESLTGHPIYITQRDIREIQLAKGAIAAGIRILIDSANILSEEEIQEILLAGSFGNYIRTKSARQIGIIPFIPLERIKPIGNAAGQGSKRLLLSEEMRKMGEKLSQKVEYIELSSRHDFQNIFADSMFFKF